MPVYRLDIGYDGSTFRGYARQEGERTVQGELEDALRTYLKTDPVTSVAGRTDAGVHALGQVVSFEHDAVLDTDRTRRALSGILGPQVSVHSVRIVPDGFNARFSAKWRRYRYILDQGEDPNPLTRGFVWHVGRPLDQAAMVAASEFFVGEHDFSSFCRARPGTSNVRRISILELEPKGPELIWWIQANAFCHQMVRSIVGYLYDVGRGFSEGSRTPKVIWARDRSVVATIAPAHGLTLCAVGYD